MSTEELRKAVEAGDAAAAEAPADSEGVAQWNTIKQALRGLEADNARLQSGLAKHVDRVCELQSRLAAANALLRSIAAYCPPEHECQQGLPSDLCEACKLREYLHGAGDEA